MDDNIQDQSTQIPSSQPTDPDENQQEEISYSVPGKPGVRIEASGAQKSWESYAPVESARAPEATPSAEKAPTPEKSEVLKSPEVSTDGQKEGEICEIPGADDASGKIVDKRSSTSVAAQVLTIAPNSDPVHVKSAKAERRFLEKVRGLI